MRWDNLVYELEVDTTTFLALLGFDGVLFGLEVFGNALATRWALFRLGLLLSFGSGGCLGAVLVSPACLVVESGWW